MIADNPKRMGDEIRIYAHRRQTPLTLGQLYEFGSVDCAETRLHAAQFLHNELPIRLAHMTVDLENLPYGLSEMPSVQRIHHLYVQSFRDILEFPHPHTDEAELAFTRRIDAIKNRHARVMPMMARGISELKAERPEDAWGDQIQTFLDRFYLSRIGIRMLIGQHIALHQRRPGWVGIICGETEPARVAEDAAQDALTLCRQHYGTAPEIMIQGRRDLTFPYIPSHLHHMLFELLKNSLRATVEFHADSRSLPPIRLILADGVEDVAIKVSDEGGGIPRSGMPRIWSYLYTTAPPPREAVAGNDEVDPIAGLGFGLPITRLYARYFGGDLQVISLDGFGTDAYLHLNRLGTHEEVLP